MTKVSSVFEQRNLKPVNPYSISIIEAIKQYCLEPDITIRFIASHCGCSEGYIRQICRTKFGGNPHSIIRLYRIEKACSLIAGTQKPLSEISRICGYGTEKAFRDAFKRVHKISPQGIEILCLEKKMNQRKPDEIKNLCRKGAPKRCAVLGILTNDVELCSFVQIN